MPVQAMRRTIDGANAQMCSKLKHQVQGLIETPVRLEEYDEMAETEGIQQQVNRESDVGNQRGGMEKGDDIEA